MSAGNLVLFVRGVASTAYARRATSCVHRVEVPVFAEPRLSQQGGPAPYYKKTGHMYQTEDKALEYYLTSMKEHCDNKC